MGPSTTPTAKTPQPASDSGRFASRLLVTAFIALLTAGASWWLIGRKTIQCDSLAPLTVLATLAAFLMSVCFRQMGRHKDRRSRWFLFVCLLIAAAALFADFRYVRHYRDFCDDLRQQMRGAPSSH
jgi:dolichol kinase